MNYLVEPQGSPDKPATTDMWIALEWLLKRIAESIAGKAIDASYGCDTVCGIHST